MSKKSRLAASKRERLKRAARKKLKGRGTILSALGGRDLPSPPEAAPAAPPATRKIGEAPGPPPLDRGDPRLLSSLRPSERSGGWLAYAKNLNRQAERKARERGGVGDRFIPEESSAGSQPHPQASRAFVGTGRYAERKTPPIDWAKELKGSK